MSFFGGGGPKLSSEEKFARVEAEVDVQGDMFTRYFPFSHFLSR
jgi:hypothetical protein